VQVPSMAIRYGGIQSHRHPAKQIQASNQHPASSKISPRDADPRSCYGPESGLLGSSGPVSGKPGLLGQEGGRRGSIGMYCPSTVGTVRGYMWYIQYSTCGTSFVRRPMRRGGEVRRDTETVLLLQYQYHPGKVRARPRSCTGTP
jgi:hypothetical protein